MSSKIFFPASPVNMTLRNGTTADLATAVRQYCPGVFAKFRRPWWLFNGDLQTMYCVAGNFKKIDQILYQRVHLGLTDGGTVGLDFAPLKDDHLPDNTPIIVALHGLTGGSFEPYIRALLCEACAPVEEGGLGYRAVVVHCRGCGDVPVTSQQFYTGGYSGDLRQTLIYLSHRYPDAPLLGVGFSVGSNILAKYIGEEEDNSRLSAGCLLACPWNLIDNSLALQKTFWGRFAYTKAMGLGMRVLLERNAEALSTGPDYRVTKTVEVARKMKSPTLQQFDAAITSKIGGPPPLFPFPDVDTYYRWASTDTSLPTMRTPVLAFNAADDPIVQKRPPLPDNPYVIMVLTHGGGHLGWFEPAPGLFGTKRWICKPVLQWLKMHGEQVMHTRRGKDIYMDEAGFLHELGSSASGCKVVPGGCIVDQAMQDRQNDSNYQGL